MRTHGLKQDESEASNVPTLAAKGIWWVRPDLNWGLGAPSRTKLKQTADLVRRAQREARIGPSTTADSILERVALGLEGRLEADEFPSMAIHGQTSTMSGQTSAKRSGGGADGVLCSCESPLSGG